MQANKQLAEFYCPTDKTHDIGDPEKSTKDWIAYLGKCPICGSQPKFRMVITTKHLKPRGGKQ